MLRPENFSGRHRLKTTCYHESLARQCCTAIAFMLLFHLLRKPLDATQNMSAVGFAVALSRSTFILEKSSGNVLPFRTSQNHLSKILPARRCSVPHEEQYGQLRLFILSAKRS